MGKDIGEGCKDGESDGGRGGRGEGWKEEVRGRACTMRRTASNLDEKTRFHSPQSLSGKDTSLATSGSIISSLG